jgi:probable HAF family extracellular repeat protein
MMQRLRNWATSLPSLTAATLAVVIATSGPSAYGQKGGGKNATPPPPPPPPASPVKYKIIPILSEEGNARGICGNKITGWVRSPNGQREAFIYIHEPSGSKVYWLNDVDPQTAYDPDLCRYRLEQGVKIDQVFLNSHGQMAVFALDQNGCRDFRFTPAVRNLAGEIIQPALFTELALPGGRLRGINDDGDVIGSFEGFDGYLESFIWSQHRDTETGVAINRMVLLDGLGETGAYVQGLNSRADGMLQAVGSSSKHAFVYNFDAIDGTGTMRDLGVLREPTATKRNQEPDVPTSSASAINELGDIVGRAQVDRTYEHAFLCPGGGQMIDLGTLGGLQSWAYDINNAGHVIGSSWTDGNSGPNNERAFIYIDGVMYDLAAGVVENPDGLLIDSVGLLPSQISDDGWITGNIRMTLDSYEKQPVLLIPVTQN